MSAHELLEKMEEAGHAAHGGHGHGGGHAAGGPGKQIGITMAVLGVMLAFCAAMVGSARTDLLKSTVEQSNLWSKYQGESTKYRVMQADYEMLHALTPSKEEVKKFEDRLQTVKRVGGKSDDEDTAELKEAIHVATTELADVLAPDKEDEDRLSGFAAKYKQDMAEAKEDAESYEAVIEAHHEEAEWYERAQLCAEVGIVIASIALLLSSRKVWLVAVVIGIAGGSIVAYTFAHTQSTLRVAEARIEEAKRHTADTGKEEGAPDEGAPAEAPKPAASAAPKASGAGAEPAPKPSASDKPAPAPKKAPEKPKNDVF